LITANANLNTWKKVNLKLPPPLSKKSQKMSLMMGVQVSLTQLPTRLLPLKRRPVAAMAEVVVVAEEVDQEITPSKKTLKLLEILVVTKCQVIREEVEVEVVVEDAEGKTTTVTITNSVEEEITREVTLSAETIEIGVVMVIVRAKTKTGEVMPIVRATTITPGVTTGGAVIKTTEAVIRITEADVVVTKTIVEAIIIGRRTMATGTQLLIPGVKSSFKGTMKAKNK
jgi:hypothetical protein